VDIFKRTMKKRMETVDEDTTQTPTAPDTPASGAPTMSQADFTKAGPQRKRPTPPPELLKKQGYKKGGLVRGAGKATKGVRAAKVR